MEKIIVGVDAGTTAVKAVAFNLNGEILNAAHRSVPVNYGRRGEAEQDLNQIWEAVADALAELTSKTGDHEIVGVGLTGQGDGAWLLDKEHKPLRPAAIWMDGRAGKRVAQWQQDGRAQRVLEVTGTTIFPALVPILLDEFEAVAGPALRGLRHQVLYNDMNHGNTIVDPDQPGRAGKPPPYPDGL